MAALREGFREVLTPGEVARIFGVDPKTVNRWTRSTPPRIESFRTPGGHRRFYADHIRAILKADSDAQAAATKHARTLSGRQFQAGHAVVSGSNGKLTIENGE